MLAIWLNSRRSVSFYQRPNFEYHANSVLIRSTKLLIVYAYSFSFENPRSVISVNFLRKKESSILELPTGMSWFLQFKSISHIISFEGFLYVCKIHFLVQKYLAFGLIDVVMSIRIICTSALSKQYLII